MSLTHNIGSNVLPHVISLSIPLRFNFSGLYSGFYTPTSQQYPFYSVEMNTTYLVNDLSISGSITNEIFVSSFYNPDPLRYKLISKLTHEVFSSKDFFISQYYTEKEVSQYIRVNRKNDGILLDIKGSLRQVYETVGIEEINIILSLSTYEISSDSVQTDLLRGTI